MAVVVNTAPVTYTVNVTDDDPNDEIAVLENGYETVLDSKRHLVEQPDYEIVVVRKGKQGWFLSRKILFSRTDLQPHRQFIYDENGRLVTDVRYGDYKDYEGITFPLQIEIERPQRVHYFGCAGYQRNDGPLLQAVAG